jgi:hypothetical protein
MAAVPFAVLDVLEVLVVEEETVDAVSLFEPPHATSVVSSAQIMAPRETVFWIITAFPRRNKMSVRSALLL